MYCNIIAYFYFTANQFMLPFYSDKTTYKQKYCAILLNTVHQTNMRKTDKARSYLLQQKLFEDVKIYRSNNKYSKLKKNLKNII